MYFSLYFNSPHSHSTSLSTYTSRLHVHNSYTLPVRKCHPPSSSLLTSTRVKATNQARDRERRAQLTRIYCIIRRTRHGGPQVKGKDQSQGRGKAINMNMNHGHKRETRNERNPLLRNPRVWACLVGMPDLVAYKKVYVSISPFSRARTANTTAISRLIA
jgi:hypothetical protein